jgi:hypothetical protein
LRRVLGLAGDELAGDPRSDDRDKVAALLPCRLAW